MINLLPLEKYSKAQYFALVFMFKKRSKSEEKRRCIKSEVDVQNQSILNLFHKNGYRQNVRMCKRLSLHHLSELLSPNFLALEKTLSRY